jgi:multiple sugar transport system permease protein
MLPLHVLVVPQYIFFSQLGMVNTYFPLLLPKLLAADAFFTFLMVQFIRTIPRELDAAAWVDGAAWAPCSRCPCCRCCRSSCSS